MRLHPDPSSLLPALLVLCLRCHTCSGLNIFGGNQGAVQDDRSRIHQPEQKQGAHFYPRHHITQYSSPVAATMNMPKISDQVWYPKMYHAPVPTRYQPPPVPIRRAPPKQIATKGKHYSKLVAAMYKMRSTKKSQRPKGGTGTHNIYHPANNGKGMMDGKGGKGMSRSKGMGMSRSKGMWMQRYKGKGTIIAKGKGRRRPRRPIPDTMTPTEAPTASPTTFMPTMEPSFEPSLSFVPSGIPSLSSFPSGYPSISSESPSESYAPSGLDETDSPTSMPTSGPTSPPSSAPSVMPSDLPSGIISGIPSDLPSTFPSESYAPSNGDDAQAVSPGRSPVLDKAPITSLPSESPSKWPSVWPSVWPSEVPSVNEADTTSKKSARTDAPSEVPSFWPSMVPSVWPSTAPNVADDSVNTVQSPIVLPSTSRPHPVASPMVGTRPPLSDAGTTAETPSKAVVLRVGEDKTIANFDLANGAYEHSSYPFVYVEETQGRSRLRRQFLLKFELDPELPEKAMIHFATLRLSGMSTDLPLRISVHRMLISWDHETADGDLFGSEAQELIQADNVEASFVSSATFLGSDGARPSLDVTEDLQFWVYNPDNNFGWVFLAEDGELGVWGMWGVDGAFGPELLVEYTVP